MLLKQFTVDRGWPIRRRFPWGGNVPGINRDCVCIRKRSKTLLIDTDQRFADLTERLVVGDEFDRERDT